MTLQHPPTLSTGLAPGTSLQEYTLIDVLGIGGFGITYLARDNHLQHQVAIKEFFPSSLAVRNPASGAVAINTEQYREDFSWGRSRFIDEARTLARFRHANIVQVYRFFEANNTGYMVMAYEEGKSLESLFKEKTEWSEAEVSAILFPLLDGLQAVHQAGFLHRDIKPANILIRARDGSPVLLDFGSSRSAVSTHTLTALVSPGYGPVEQYFDEGQQGPWTDIYAMGAVLYRLVCGVAPIPSHQRLKKDALVPATFAAKGAFRPQFLKAIEAALTIDEAKRPQSVDAWRRMFAEQAAAPTPAVPVSESTAPLATATTTTAPAAFAATTTPLRTTRPSGTIDRAAGGLSLWKMGVAAVMAVSALVFYMKKEPEPAPAPPALVASPSAAPAASADASAPPAPPPPPAPHSDSEPAVDSRPAPNTAHPAPLAVAASETAAGGAEGAPMPPGEAISACEGKSSSASCRFTDAQGQQVSGTCTGAAISGRALVFCRPAMARAMGTTGTAGAGGAATQETPPERSSGSLRPHEAACRDKRVGDHCSFVGRQGESLSGSCTPPPNAPANNGMSSLVCRIEGGPPG